MNSLYTISSRVAVAAASARDYRGALHRLSARATARLAARVVCVFVSSTCGDCDGTSQMASRVAGDKERDAKERIVNDPGAKEPGLKVRSAKDCSRKKRSLKDHGAKERGAKNMVPKGATRKGAVQK